MSDQTYAHYDYLRSKTPLFWSGHRWVAMGYECVRDGLIDQRFTAKRASHFFPKAPDPAFDQLKSVLDNWVFFTDPSEGIENRAFVRERVGRDSFAELDARLSAELDQVLAQVRPGSKVDWLAQLITPFRVLLLSHLFKVAPSQARLLLEPSDALFHFVKASIPTEHLTQRAAEALTTLESLLASSPLHGRPDAMSQYSQVAMALMLLETTLGSTLATLTESPAVWRQLAADPSLIPKAVQECIRLESPTQATSRLAREDCEFHGCNIGKGELISLVLGAANRDPLVFPNPATIDLERTVPQLGMGSGAKRCPSSFFSPGLVARVMERLIRTFPQCPFQILEKKWMKSLEARRLSVLTVLAHNVS